ncbi:hypothetical protein HYY73_04910 [Candidatus Woesearchaeota archaeon]|nr:hypothetical protein [Candidatus Woesearchaeota archaeon]
MALGVRKFIAVAMFALLLAVVLSLAVTAASGPSAARTVKKEEKPQPKAGEVTPEEAAKYKCSTIDTMRERIKCRLQLKEENEYDYLPEECRAQVNESRGKCVSDYHKSQNCWKSLKDDERFDCAKKSFGLVGTVASQKAVCDGLTGQNRSDCILQLRDRVDAVVKFRIYNLEEKAQRLIEKGLATEEAATNFITQMEQQKQNYNDAKTVAEKKAVIKGVQRLWKEFISNAKGKGQGQKKNESNSA